MALYACRECGNQISTQAKNCPKCGAPTLNPSVLDSASINKSVFGAFGLAVVGVLIFASFKQTDAPKTNNSNSSLSDAQTERPPTQSDAASVALMKAADALNSAPPIGEEQKRFISIVNEVRDLFQAAETEMQKGATRPVRAERLCSAFPSIKINNWIGKITKLSTNSDGNGILYIDIGDKILFTTFNNSFSDASYGTLIETKTSLYSKLLPLQVGNIVRFSGTLFSNKKDCFLESSLSVATSVRNPEFIIRFTDVNKI